MVRVLHICSENPTRVLGGMGMHVSKLLPALQPHCEASLLCFGDKEDIEHLSYPAMLARFEGAAPLEDGVPSGESNIRRLSLSAIKAGKYDVVHAHDWTAVQAAIDYRSFYQVPIVHTWHLFQLQIGQVEKLLHHPRVTNAIKYEMAGWNLADKCVVCSNDMKERGQQYYGEREVTVIPNGVDVEEWQREVKAPHYHGSGKLIVLFSGRWTIQKGVTAIMDAMEASDEFEWWIMGPWQDHDYPEPNRLRELAEKYPERIKLLGIKHGDERHYYYAQADFGVMPSLAEPFGIAALEFFASGTPLVTTGFDGLGEFCNEGNSILIEPTGEGIIEGLKRGYSAHQLESAYQTAKKHSWDEVAKQTVKVYEEVLCQESSLTSQKT